MKVEDATVLVAYDFTKEYAICVLEGDDAENVRSENDNYDDEDDNK
jgi:hypothetical protein